MKRLLAFPLTIALLASLILSGCSEPATTVTETATTSTTVTVTETVTATTTEPTTTEPTTTEPTTTEPTPVSNWWDALGEPEYGGTLTIGVGAVKYNPDLYNGFFFGENHYWEEALFMRDWTVDRDEWSFKTDWTPEKYYTGLLAESWEMPDLQTIIIHLREGVHWQDKAPVNGREFTAEDVEFHYQRMLGLAEGYEPAATYAGLLSNWENVVATDDYTVEITFKEPTIVGLASVMNPFAYSYIAAREVVEDGLSEDWQYAAGTGPWMLADFEDSVAITYEANPNYWGYDQRHPENQIPYVDTLKLICITDTSAQIAAIRTAQVEALPLAGMGTGIPWAQAESVMETDPELLAIPYPAPSQSLTFRVDQEPFNDIRVRKAINMAIDRTSIGDDYYNGLVDPTPCGLLSPLMTGYAYSYEEWPQSLKDEYTYNVDAAKELLAEAGVPTGFDTALQTAQSEDQALMQVYQAMLREIGIEMEITVSDYGTFQAIKSGLSWQGMISDGLAFVEEPSVVIEKRTSSSDVLNPAQCSDPVYDEIVANYYASTSLDEAMGYAYEADKYAIEQHWSMYGLPNVKYGIFRPEVKGYSGEVHFQWGAGDIYARLWK